MHRDEAQQWTVSTRRGHNGLDELHTEVGDEATRKAAVRRLAPVLPQAVDNAMNMVGGFGGGGGGFGDVRVLVGQVRQLDPTATVGEVLDAIAQLNADRRLQLHTINETQMLGKTREEQAKAKVIWSAGRPLAGVMLPNGGAEIDLSGY